MIDPATLGQVVQRGEVTADELNQVLTRVNAAQKQWAKLDAKTRAAYLHKLASRSLNQTSP